MSKFGSDLKTFQVIADLAVNADVISQGVRFNYHNVVPALCTARDVAKDWRCTHAWKMATRSSWQIAATLTTFYDALDWLHSLADQFDTHTATNMHNRPIRRNIDFSKCWDSRPWPWPSPFHTCFVQSIYQIWSVYLHLFRRYEKRWFGLWTLSCALLNGAILNDIEWVTPNYLTTQTVWVVR